MNSTILRRYSRTYSVIFAAVLVLLIITVFGAGAEQMIYSVVNAPTILPCNMKNGLDVETVRWTTNLSAVPFVSYFPKDGFISPSDHDQRLSITDASKLEFSFLRKSDLGTYTCIVTSNGQPNDLIYAVNLTVLDGCPVWSHAPPLLASGDGCSSGGALNYAQRCNFICEPGFQLIGNTSTECLSNGELSNGLPECERIICTIGILPSHLVDKHNTCVNDSHVGYGTTCDFECKEGYHLNGIGTVNLTCTNEDGHVNYIPECQEKVGPRNLGFISFAFIPVLLIPVVVYWFIKKNKQEERMTQLDADGFVDFVVEQVGESRKTMTRILRTLKNSELKIVQNLPAVNRKENELSQDEHSISKTFASYVAVIVRCVQCSDQDVADEVKNDLFSATGDNASLYSLIRNSAVSYKEDIKGLQENQSYFTVVHSAYLKLLAALRFNIEDDNERRQRSTAVFREMNSYFKAQQEETGDTESKSSKKSSKPSTLTSSTVSNGLKGNYAFAEMCLKNISKVTSVEDGIRMRYNILSIMIDSNDTDVIQSKVQEDDNETSIMLH